MSSKSPEKPARNRRALEGSGTEIVAPAVVAATGSPKESPSALIPTLMTLEPRDDALNVRTANVKLPG